MKYIDRDTSAYITTTPLDISVVFFFSIKGKVLKCSGEFHIIWMVLSPCELCSVVTPEAQSKAVL